MKIEGIIFVLVSCFFLQVTNPALTAGQETGNFAPINTEFINYIEKLNHPVLQEAIPEHALGYIPSPIDRSHLKGKQIIQTRRIMSQSPPSYDLRNLGKLTSVKNQ